MIFNLYGIFFCFIVGLINLYLYRKSKENPRESKLELLRIIAMIMIVAYHYALHGSNFFTLEFNTNKLILDLFIVSGKIGVNLFIMISSYYLLSTKFNLKKIVKLIIKVKIYGFIFLVIFLYLDKVSIINIIRSIFPIIYSLYWFISAYLIFYLVSPILNILLINLEKNFIKKIIIISVLIFSIFSHLFKASLFYSSIIWFFILYIIVYYIKNYIKIEVISMKKLKIFSIIFFSCIYFSILIFEFLGKYIVIFKNNTIYFTSENSILVLLFSISFFLIFLKMNSIKNKFINYIASATLGIYLIHDNRLVRFFLYYKILDNLKYINKNCIIFIFHSIFSIVLIFNFCICIDKILDIIIRKFITLKQIEKIERLIKNIFERIIKKLEKYEKTI